nr:YwqG family protein [Leisingera daeponensis]
MFCDCGVVEFYIQPADLAAKDSSKAYSLTAGG